MKQELRERIAGEITLSANPGSTITKWREVFGLTKQALAVFLKISPSVISDYESGRRKSPGVGTVKKIVDALLDMDEQSGSKILRKYTLDTSGDAIMSIREFPVGVTKKRFIKAIDGKNVTPIEPEGDLHGFTVIDSVKAITRFDSSDYLKVYGWSSHRALIFTGIQYGRSPMIAIRAHPLKPAMVVYHRPERVDELAIKLAEMEGVSLITTDVPLRDLLDRLDRIKE